MRVRIVSFGVLKDWLGDTATAIELPAGARVSQLLDVVRDRLAQRGAGHVLQGIAVSVNAEYAQADRILHEGDEVGLLPPVSGGAPDAAETVLENSGERNVVVALTRERIDAERLVAEAKAGEDGAVVVFDGIVRNHTRGRKTLYLDYEAYEEMALKQMRELGEQARERFGVRSVTIAHRLGRLEIGETSVLVVVASAHRAAAFDACRWAIDTLKQKVPIWKKETFADGAVWAPGDPFPQEIAFESTETQQDG